MKKTVLNLAFCLLSFGGFGQNPIISIGMELETEPPLDGIVEQQIYRELIVC